MVKIFNKRKLLLKKNWTESIFKELWLDGWNKNRLRLIKISSENRSIID